MNNEAEVLEEKVIQNQNNNKKGKGSVVTIILLILIILGLVAYIAYDKGLILKDKTETKENNAINEDNTNTRATKDIALDDSKFIDIYNKLSKYTYKMNRENGYDSFLDKELATIGLKQFKESDFTETEEKDQGQQSYYTFNSSTLIKYLKDYFGSEVKVNNEKLVGHYVATNVNFNGSGMRIISYDGKDTFKVSFSGIGGTSGPQPRINERKLISAKEIGDKIVVEEKAIYIDTNYDYSNNKINYTIYGEPESTIGIRYDDHYRISIDYKTFNNDEGLNNQSINIDNYLDKASTITHIYKLNKETNKYYFVSSSIK